MWLAAAVVAMGAGALSAVPAGAAPRAGFTLGPSVTVTAPVTGAGSASTGFVRLTTGRKATAFESPVSFGRTEFRDSQIGNCWDQYLANGQLIPKNTTCVIAVQFQAAALGAYSTTMTVRECRNTTVDNDGRVRCVGLAGSASLTVNGTGTQPPDLVPTNVVRSTTNFHYTVTFANNGSGPAGDTVVQGYWSPDQIAQDVNDAGACGTTFFGAITAGSMNNTVVVECSAGPRTTDEYLIVELDPGNVVGESNDTNNIFVLWLNPVT